MKLPLKALAAFAVTLATTASMAEDPAAAADCSREAVAAAAPCATPHPDHTIAMFTAQAKREVARDEHAVGSEASRVEHGIARYAATARPPTNGAVLADGVTIDGGQ